MNNLFYSPEARNDLDEIWAYIYNELQNPAAAQRTVSNILDTIEKLRDFSEIGICLFMKQCRGVENKVKSRTLALQKCTDILCLLVGQGLCSYLRASPPSHNIRGTSMADAPNCVSKIVAVLNR